MIIIHENNCPKLPRIINFYFYVYFMFARHGILPASERAAASPSVILSRWRDGVGRRRPQEASSPSRRRSALIYSPSLWVPVTFIECWV